MSLESEYPLLYQRLGLTAEATQCLLKTFLEIDGIFDESPTIEDCKKLVKGGSDVYGFNQFLKILDRGIDRYTTQILKNYKSGDYIRLLTYENNDELWEYHEKMHGCPLELHYAIINRTATLGSFLNINISYDNIKNKDHEDIRSWGNTNDLIYPVLDQIKIYFKEKYRQNYLRENWSMT